MTTHLHFKVKYFNQYFCKPPAGPSQASRGPPPLPSTPPHTPHFRPGKGLESS